MHRILAVIPARSGSKGLPNKNILNCAGKPLIQWTIEAALGASNVTEVLVTTDSMEIQNIAKQAGAWSPFLRDEKLSGDESSIVDVVKDAIFRVDGLKDAFDLVLLLQPTSPLRTSEHIDEAIEYFLNQRKSNKDTLVSVMEIEQKVLWTQGINSKGYMYSHFNIDLTNPRRQDLSNCYSPNGAIYLSPILDFSGFYGEHTIPFIMQQEASIDVDYKSDLDLVSALLSNL